MNPYNQGNGQYIYQNYNYNSGYENASKNEQMPLNNMNKPGSQEDLNSKKETELVKNSELFIDKLEEEGQIKLAQEHGEAAKISHIVKAENLKDVKFCPDCIKPRVDEKNVKRYQYCEADPKDFVDNYGSGIYFFFFFLQFLIFVLICFAVVGSVPFMWYSNKYFKEIRKFCNEYYLPQDANENLADYEDRLKIKECEKFIDEGSFALDTYIATNSSTLEFEAVSLDFSYMISGITVIDYIDFFKKIREESKNSKFFKIETICNFNMFSLIASVTIFMLNVVYVLYSQARLEEVDYVTDTPSDFSVLIEGFNAPGLLPENISTGDHIPKDKLSKINYQKQHIKNFLLSKQCIQKLHIEDINLIYELDKVNEIKDELRELYRIRRVNKGEESYGGFLCCCKKSMSQIDQEIIQKEQDLTKALAEAEYTGMIIATFNTESEKDEFLKYFPNSFLSKIFINNCKSLIVLIFPKYFQQDTIEITNLKKYLSAYEAPEPEDIIWENLQYTFISKLIRSSLGNIACILLIGISFVANLGLNKIQANATDENEDNFALKYGISIGISVVVAAINTLMCKVFVKFSANEKHWTNTDYYLSLSVKLTIFMFVNSAIIPYVTNGINIGFDDYSVLISNMFSTFLTASLVTPILSLSCYDLLLQKIFKWLFITRKYEENAKTPEYTQKELNAYFEDPEMIISDHYSSHMKNILMAFFFFPIFPLGIFIVLLGVVLSYFVEKFKVLYVYKAPGKLNEDICFFFLDYFVYAIFVFGIGNYIFIGGIYDTQLFELIIIIVYPVIGLLPYNKYIRSYNFTEIRFSNKNVPYLDVYFDFPFDYERLNPSTQSEGVKTYLNNLLKKGDINQQQYNEFMNKIEHINIKELFTQMNASRTLTKTMAQDNKQDTSGNRLLRARTMKFRQNNVFTSLLSGLPSLNNNHNHGSGFNISNMIQNYQSSAVQFNQPGMQYQSANPNNNFQPNIEQKNNNGTGVEMNYMGYQGGYVSNVNV